MYFDYFFLLFAAIFKKLKEQLKWNTEFDFNWKNQMKKTMERMKRKWRKLKFNFLDGLHCGKKPSNVKLMMNWINQTDQADLHIFMVNFFMVKLLYCAYWCVWVESKSDIFYRLLHFILFVLIQILFKFLV